MAFRFDSASSNRIIMADNAAFTFLDADWTVGGLVRCTSRSGTVTRRILSYMTGTTKYFIVDVGDPSAGVIPDDIQAQFKDDDGTVITATSTSNPFASNTSWTHVCITRSGTTMTIYINGSSVASGSNAGFDALDAGDWKWGNNQYDANAWQGDMAEWGKWDRLLSSAEIAGLVAGYSPACYPDSLKFYIPMIRNYNEIKIGTTVTNNGTTVVEHPRIIYCD